MKEGSPEYKEFYDEFMEMSINFMLNIKYYLFVMAWCCIAWRCIVCKLYISNKITLQLNFTF